MNSNFIKSDTIEPLVALMDFKKADPKILLSQEESLERLTTMHASRAQDDKKHSVAPLVRRYGVKPPNISERRFEAVDFGERDATIQERARFFNTRATEIMSEFYTLSETPPEELIHVTCTGYVSPSAAQLTVNSRGWSGKTNVTHAYHMGCYAALPAIRMAEGLIAARHARNEPNARADIVHTEMCALHMNPSNTSPEQLVVQSLFADGHMRYSCVHPNLVRRGFSVRAIREEIVSDSQNDMSWLPADGGMQMTLSREVPGKISSSLRPFLSALIQTSGLDFGETLKTATFAVHPGGPKIIDSVQDVLELSETQVAQSKNVLRTRGNMSSATLPHVWESILISSPKHQHPVVSLAFGPGLTIFGSVFTVINR